MDLGIAEMSLLCKLAIFSEKKVAKDSLSVEGDFSVGNLVTLLRWSRVFMVVHSLRGADALKSVRFV